jgi:branched-chain amino acid aminotransferase
MYVKKTIQSKIDKVDFNNLQFGTVYSDHMLYCEYIHNKWQSPKIIPFQEIALNPNASVFHYGQSVFEGLKAYKDMDNNVFLFRVIENYKRINNSAMRLSIPTITKEIFINGIIQLVNIDSKWIPKKYGESLYIRPFIIANGDILKAIPSNKYMFIVITTPSSTYYNKPLKVKIERKYSRSMSGGVGFTKAAGNYAASFYPTQIAINEGYDQLIWTDSKYHKYLEESGAMNIFIHLFNGDLITPPTSDSILPGITRDSIIKIARDNNINVIEKKINIEALIKDIKNYKIKEIFGCGTAVITQYIKYLGYKNNKFLLPNIDDNDRISFKIKKNILDIQHNILEDKYNWMIHVK